MRLTLVTPPDDLPVTLAELKRHMAIEHISDDALLNAAIETATAELDGRKGKLGRCLIAQQWRMTLEGFSRCVVLPFPNIIAIDALSYTDAAGVSHDVTSDAYRVAGIGDDEPAEITPTPGTAWPRACGVSVLFKAGYGADAESVPGPLRQWIKMRAAALYEFREAVASGSDAVRMTPGFDDTLQDYRVWAC